MQSEAISLLELNGRISSALNSAPSLSNVWIIAETSDVRLSNGHCYMELIEKDANSGSIRARARATIWAGQYVRINAHFRQATGSPLESGIKVMICASVNYHPAYGLSLNITDVNPEYTLGDLLRRRREMLQRLEAEGILNLNRSLQWADAPLRIAVISAAGSAGYGDFINQIYSNRHCLRFTTRLFPAIMQGERAAASIIDALEQVAQADDDFDCVVIIRGGGSTGDLASFDNYELAANIAMFPTPVVIGIGHERDVTLLDYVANTRVKTPTAAAELLIDRGSMTLDRLQRIGGEILDCATSRINLAHRKLENISAQIQALSTGVISRQTQRIGVAFEDSLRTAINNVLQRHNDRLTAIDELITTLSPEVTLRRGFSITRINGHAVTSTEQLLPGATITTTLASGEIKSTIIES